MERRLDARYVGQSYELSISGEDLAPEVVSTALHEAHGKRFGYSSPHASVEIVNVRVIAVGETDKPVLPYREPEAVGRPSSLSQVSVYGDGTAIETQVYERTTLLPGTEIQGPAILIQTDTTTWVPAEWIGRVDGWYNVLLSRPES